MNELCTDGDIEQLKDAVSIRQEFAEWLLREDKSVNHDIVSLEYMGEGSEYDIYFVLNSIMLQKIVNGITIASGVVSLTGLGLGG